MIRALICAQLCAAGAACVKEVQLKDASLLTFISWLISLFTGCAGFLLRLFSGGLPFSISGIVLGLAGSDPDQWGVSAGEVFAESLSEGCHSRWQRLSFPDVWVPHLGLRNHSTPLNMRVATLRAGGWTIPTLSGPYRCQARPEAPDASSDWEFQSTSTQLTTLAK